MVAVLRQFEIEHPFVTPSEIVPPLRPLNRGLTKSVAAILLAAVLVIDCGLAAFVLMRRDEDLARHVTDTQNLTQAVEVHAARTIEALDQLMIGFGEAALTSPHFSSDRLAIARQLARNPEAVALYAVTPRGEVRSIGNSNAAPEMPIAAAALLAQHRNSAARGLLVSAIAADPDGRRSSVLLSREFTTRDGAFAGIVAGLLDLGEFGEFYDAIKPGRSGSIGLFAADGRLLFRSPADARLVGRKIAGGELGQSFAAGRMIGSLRIESPIDGQERLMSYRAIPSAPLIVAVTTSIDDALADSRRRMILVGVLAGLATIALAISALMLVRDANHHEFMSKTLALNEARFRDFASMSSDWLWEQDAELRYSYISEGGQRFLERPIAEHIGKKRRDSGFFGLSEIEWSEHEADLVERRPFVLTGQRRDAAGSIRTIRISGTPMFDAAGRFAGYRGTAKDVTEESIAATLIEENRRLLRQVIDALPARVTVKDRNLRYVLVNMRHAEFLGASQDDILGNRFDAMALPTVGVADISGHKTKIVEMDRQVLETGRPILSREIRTEMRDGSSEIALYSKIPLADPQGRTDAILTVAVDITSLKSLEHELERQRELLTAVINALPDRISVKDTDLRVIIANPAQAAIFGVDPKDMVGRRFSDFVPIGHRRNLNPPWTERIEAKDRSIFASGQSSLYREVHWLTDDATQKVDLVSKIPIVAADGKVASVLTVASDITDRKLAVEALARAKEMAETASRSKSEFLANMSHELRTPLNAIIGFAEIMSASPEVKNAKHREYLGDILEGGRHLLDIINDILDLSRIESDKLELRETAFSLDRVFAPSVALVMARAEQAGVTIRTELQQYIGIRADQVRLKQILVNLLTNAVKFTPRNGTVTLASHIRPGERIEISVADTGIGMTAEEVEIALRPFGQVATVLTKNHEGVGLGLPLTRSLTELHGGELLVESCPGKGTTVRVVMPAWRTVALAETMPRGVRGA